MTSPLFSDLKIGSTYVFVFGHGVEAVIGKFTGMAGGCLHVIRASEGGTVAPVEYELNPNLIIHTRLY